MPKANIVHSTRPTDARSLDTCENELLVASRRRLLAIAGCVVATPSIALAGLGEAPVPAEAAPNVDPYFHELKAQIEQHLSAWRGLEAECKRRDRILRKWEKRHPSPQHSWPRDPGYSPTAHSDWMQRWQNVMRSLKLGDIKPRRASAADAYRRAVWGFSIFEADNVAELFFKVETATALDQDGVIATAVLRDVTLLRKMGVFGERSPGA